MEVGCSACHHDLTIHFSTYRTGKWAGVNNCAHACKVKNPNTHELNSGHYIMSAIYQTELLVLYLYVKTMFIPITSLAYTDTYIGAAKASQDNHTHRHF
jgi:hypothetical protein